MVVKAPAPQASRTPGRAEADRVRAVLLQLIEFSGLSRRALRKRLVEQGGGLNLAGALSGRNDLKLHHVLDILRALGVHPVELFRLAFAEPASRSPLLRSVEELLAPLRPQPMPRGAGAGGSEIEGLRRRASELAERIEQLAARSTSQTSARRTMPHDPRSLRAQRRTGS